MCPKKDSLPREFNRAFNLGGHIQLGMARAELAGMGRQANLVTSRSGLSLRFLGFGI